MNEWIIEWLEISFPDSYSNVPAIKSLTFLHFHWSENLKISLQTLKIKHQWAFCWVETQGAAWEEGKGERDSRWEIEAETCFALQLKDTQRQELSLMLPWLPDLWGRGSKSQSRPFCMARWTRILWRPARAHASEQRKTAKQEMWLPPSRPLLNFMCDKPLFINPRTAHGHRGEESNAVERGKQLEIQLVL